METSRFDFRDLFETAPDGIIVANLNGIALVNDKITSMFGYEPEELIGQRPRMLIAERFHGLIASQSFGNLRPLERGSPVELIGCRKDGSEFPIEVTFAVTPPDRDSRFIVMDVRDLTERRQLEAERESLRAELETERERQRIGMDLHDGIMQAIYAVSLTLELASEDLGNSPDEARLHVNRAIDQLHGVVKDIRSYIFDLRPRAYGGDLQTALLNLANEFRQNSSIETTTSVATFLPPVSHEAGLAIYHIAHEALSNVRKHAQARAVHINLEAYAEQLLLSIQDNGRGFDATQDPGESHRGLRNMRTRVAALGGDLHLVSSPGDGATIVLRVPILPEKP